jgi:hypothetical protein
MKNEKITIESLELLIETDPNKAITDYGVDCMVWENKSPHEVILSNPFLPHFYENGRIVKAIECHNEGFCFVYENDMFTKYDSCFFGCKGQVMIQSISDPSNIKTITSDDEIVSINKGDKNEKNI